MNTEIRTKYLVAIQWHSCSVKETCLNSTYKSIEGPTSRRGRPTSACKGSTSRPKTNKSRHLFSRETVTIVDNLGLTDTQRGNVKTIIEAIQTYVEGQINESVEHRNFRRRSQQQGETFDDFLVLLREL